MIKTRRGARRPGFPLLPGEDAPHVPCGACSRCTRGIGQDQDPNASDCWVSFLDVIVPVEKESA